MAKIETRKATAEDTHHLAKFVNLASEGLAHYLWERMAAPGETAWDAGQRRARREEGSFSYRNAVIAEVDGKVAGCVIGYPLADKPERIDPQMPAMFVPLQELENLAPGTWYVNVLATYPTYQRQGIASHLLGLVEASAADAGKRGLSLIVSNANGVARRLYERRGYRQVAERPMVKEDWQNDGDRWVLLVKAGAA